MFSNYIYVTEIHNSFSCSVVICSALPITDIINHFGTYSYCTPDCIESIDALYIAKITLLITFDKLVFVCMLVVSTH